MLFSLKFTTYTFSHGLPRFLHPRQNIDVCLAVDVDGNGCYLHGEVDCQLGAYKTARPF